VAKKHGVSDVTIYAWRKRFGQLEAVDVKRLRQLEAENARLKKMLAERVMDIEILKKSPKKNGKRARAPATDHLRMPTGSIGTASVRAVERSAIDGGVSVPAGSPGRTGGGCYAAARGAIPAVWVSAHSDLPGALWSHHEP
jgi:putative transposase